MSSCGSTLQRTRPSIWLENIIKRLLFGEHGGATLVGLLVECSRGGGVSATRKGKLLRSKSVHSPGFVSGSVSFQQMDIYRVPTLLLTHPAQ